MIEVIQFKKIKPDTSTETAKYRMTFECDKKGVDDFLELIKLEQAVKVHNDMVAYSEANQIKATEVESYTLYA